MNTTITGRVVVGVDGSPASVAAVRWVVRYAELTSSPVDVTSWAFPRASGFGVGIGLGPRRSAGPISPGESKRPRWARRCPMAEGR